MLPPVTVDCQLLQSRLSSKKNPIAPVKSVFVSSARWRVKPWRVIPLLNIIIIIYIIAMEKGRKLHLENGVDAKFSYLSENAVFDVSFISILYFTI